jgi:hypothetical protein
MLQLRADLLPSKISSTVAVAVKIYLLRTVAGFTCPPFIRKTDIDP